MIKIKEKLIEQLKIVGKEYENLIKEDVKANELYGKQQKARNKIINKLSDKSYKIQEEIRKIDEGVLESKHPTKSIEAAKIILEECGYKVIRL